ncbi:MAG TPA: extracellular solute-binding protein [Bryobacteraceae bacterium]|jgi:multiple sugar transport system substrate-binding protein|nr:extracellular solute-binding protein [Bryobacteraceae bacterium]
MQSDSTFRIAIRRFDPFESAIRRQWESFESKAQTGLTLEAEAFDLPALSEVLFGPESTVSGSWDVAFVNTDWVAAAHRQKRLVDLSSYLAKDPPDGYPSAWTPSLLRLQNLDGFIAGMPYHDGPECLIFRRDLFDDPREQAAYQEMSGQPLRLPSTWREFHQIARFFHRPSKGMYGTVFAAFPDGHNTVYDFLLQLWTHGGEIFGRDGSLDLNTHAAREALTWYRSILLDATAVHPRCREMDSVQSGLAFAAGEAAMMVNWFGFAAMCETMPGCRVKGRVDIGPVPHDENYVSASLNVYWLLAIPTTCPHRDVAYAFLCHCMTAEMDKLLTLEGGIGCRRSTWLDPDVARVAPFFSRLPQLHENARELPCRADWPAIAHVIDDLVIQTIGSSDPIPLILERAQNKAREMQS